MPIFGPQNVTTLYQPPYSPGLPPPEYFLFPKLKMKFADVAETQEAVTNEFKKKTSEKKNFRQPCRNCTTARKPLKMPMEIILTKKSYVSFSCFLDL
jgi:hypothetical protein